jgi:hypothetical protein
VGRDRKSGGGFLHLGLEKPMKLEQGQIWHKDDNYYRIVKWERLAIEYKAMKTPGSKEGTQLRVTKKEFCRLIKGGALAAPDSPPADLPGAARGAGPKGR